MIVAPNWTTLRHIGSKLDVQDPIQKKQFLKTSVQLILDELPDVHNVRLYRFDNDTVIVRLATDQDDNKAALLANMPHIAKALQQDDSIWIAGQKQWVYKLQVGSNILGVLEVFVDDLDDDWIVWLELLSDKVAAKLALVEPAHNEASAATDDSIVHSQARRLINASQMLLSADDAGDIVTAARYAVSDRVDALSITLFEDALSVHDVGTTGVTQNLRFTTAYATRSSIQLLQRDESVGSLPELSFVTQLRQEIPIVIDNLETDAGYLSGWMREFTATVGARQAAVLGLTSGEYIIGTLELYSIERFKLTQEEIDLYTVLASQIGNTMMSQRLLTESIEAQKFASQLVKTNKAIATAENYEQMAQAVLNDSPSDIHAVAIALFNHPFTLLGTPSQLITEAVVTRERTITERHKDAFSALDDARVTYFLHEYLEGSMMMLWNIERPRRPVMASSLVDQLKMEDVDVITSFGLNMSNSLRGLLVLAGADTLRDPGPRSAGLRALADQLAAVIENRILFQRTKEALDLIQGQYETSSRIFRANTLLDMLQAVFDFANNSEQLYESAHLVSIAEKTQVTARVTPHDANLTFEPVEIETYPASHILTVIETLEVRDVAEDVFLSKEERTRLLADGVSAFMLLPILAHDSLGGVIMLTNPNPIPTYFSRDKSRALRSVADQAGIVLENRKLLQNTETNLQQMQLLYEANRTMLSTQNDLDVLRALKNSLATDAAVLCLVNITYDADDIKSLMLEYEVTDENERAVQESISINDQELREVRRYLSQLNSNVVFAPMGAPVPGNPVRYLQDRYEMQSYATFVIREQSVITNLIFLIYDEVKPFNESTRRLHETIADQVSVSIENHNLLRQSQNATSKLMTQVRILQTISEFASRINMVSEEVELLDIGAETLVETLHVDHTGIVFFNEDFQTGTIVSEYPDTNQRDVIVNTSENPILMTDFEMRQAVAIEDVDASNTLSNDIKRDLRASGIRAILFVPLVGLNGELIGSVGLDVYQSPRTFSSSEIQLAQTIASQMAVGVQNIRLLKDSQQRAEQLQHITDFSQTAQASLQLSQMIDAALNSVPELLSVTHTMLALYDDMRDEFTIVGGWNDTNEGRAPITRSAVVPLDETTTGYVFNTGKYLYIPNLATQSRLAYPHPNNIQTLLAMPLTNRNRILGVLTVGADRVDEYTDTDIALFQQMVNQMSVAIDNARAYTQSRRLAQNKSLANEIAVQLQRQRNITEMIDLTLNEVGRAIGAKRGRIRLNTQRDSNNESGA